MTEDRYTDFLSDYLDGELDPGEQASLEQHVASCEACRTTLDELRAVVARAGALDDTAPDADLWPGIEARLARRSPGGVDDAVRRAPLREAVRRTFAFTLPQLAAAGLALMVLTGGMVWMAQSGDRRADFPAVNADAARAPQDTGVAPAALVDASYDEAIADLEQILAEGRTRLDPETIRVLEDNLRAIDQAIDQSRRALAGDPANTYLNGHLIQARQRKLALLRRASGFAAAGS